MRKQYATFELTDGTVAGPFRVIFADKVALERAARANGWDMNAEFTKVNSLLAWSAAKREGAIPADLAYDDFTDQIIDLRIDDSADVDPTRKDQHTD